MGPGMAVLSVCLGLCGQARGEGLLSPSHRKGSVSIILQHQAAGTGPESPGLCHLQAHILFCVLLSMGFTLHHLVWGCCVSGRSPCCRSRRVLWCKGKVGLQSGGGAAGLHPVSFAVSSWPPSWLLPGFSVTVGAAVLTNDDNGCCPAQGSLAGHTHPDMAGPPPLLAACGRLLCHGPANPPVPCPSGDTDG